MFSHTPSDRAGGPAFSVVGGFSTPAVESHHQLHPMTLDANTKSALRERLTFYRELGVGPLYRRDAISSGAPDDFGVELVDELAEAADRLADAAEREAQEAYLPSATGIDRATLLQVIADDIGPDCQRCKSSEEHTSELQSRQYLVC